MINRKQWVSQHDPILNAADSASPLTVGNGDFAFTVDVTGLQTLYGNGAAETPLCTMSNWGWHTIPANTPSGRYTLDDVKMDRYDFCGREVTYAVRKQSGNEQVYDWLRQNPHKINLARIGLRLKGEKIDAASLTDIRQQLHLYSGMLESRWKLHGAPCHVQTACAPDRDAVAFCIASPLLADGLTVDIDFSYGAADITAADWHSPEKHSTRLEGCMIRRRMDDLTYTVRVDAPGARLEQIAQHRIRIAAEGTTLWLAVSFVRDVDCESDSAEAILRRSEDWWAAFWEQGGAIDLSGATDPRAMELERRIVLSLYLLTIQSAGHVPPAETGLTCNSWYGKAHLEMHFWHMAWAALWGHGELLARSLPWYHAHLPEARANAARNGYRGARWPKMVADDGIDSPSTIAVLLVWQQPHILVMLELLRRALPREQQADFLQEHWALIAETAEFMADYAVKDAQGVYHIEPPVIPVQERYAPQDTRDPSFETAYWQFGLRLAIDWAKAMNTRYPARWQDVAEHMAPPPMHDGLYIAHADRPDTFDTMAEDHPSMLQCLGMLPGEGIDRSAMAATLDKVLAVWNENSLWGWDFAVMAMTAARLGKPQLAIDLLLRETNKNTYVASGNNRQVSRNDLPLYLPGNGSLLLAAAMMATAEGFPRNSSWQVSSEGLYPYF